MKLHDTYDLLMTFERCLRPEDVNATTLNASRAFGIEHFFAGAMPAANASLAEQQRCVIGGAWPEEWAKRYFYKGYLDKDPMIEHVRSQTSPLIWNNNASSSKDGNIIMNEARSFGLNNGITVPQMSLDGVKIGISFAGNHLEQDNPEMNTALTVIGSYAVAALLRTQKRAPVQRIIALSSRETEVLHWISEGKTSYEIGIILSLSKATVEKHFRTVLFKLGASNRAHAVAEAIRHGLIR